MSVPLRAVQLTEPSLFLQEHPEVQFVDLLISDMNGVVRGKRIERNSLPKVFEKGINPKSSKKVSTSPLPCSPSISPAPP